MIVRTTRSLILATALVSLAQPAATQAAQAPEAPDPRVGLKAGWNDAGEAARNMVRIAHRSRPAGFFNDSNPGDFAVINSDLAFTGHYVIQGNFNGLQIWDVSNPSNPTLYATFVCPGGQGDPSVFRHLLFMSVEETRGRVDCGTQGVADTVSPDRFRGVRIFDITDLAHPRRVAAVQTCRGSHTHTLVQDPNDTTSIYVYVQGLSRVRPAAELAGCSALQPEQDSTTSLFQIEIIRVPLAAPQDAKVVNMPRIFADSSGAIAGLTALTHGDSAQRLTRTNQCHDITVYTAFGIAAGACQGNGILLDIHDPVHPRRVAAVSDPNFAYWHSATFSNDGRKVVYTDEWGGGLAPRCRATDRLEWGADAIFVRDSFRLRFASYYKMPAPQSEQENCVAHNGSLIPVPGRDIMAQGWYQGGVSVFDFTDAAHPKEIAFFDRGPMDSTKLYLAGFWSAYWYNGHIYGSEIGRGLDVFDLQPSEYLSRDEIAAAKLVRVDLLNPSNQASLVWPARFVVARAYLDGLVRSDGLRRSWAAPIYRELARAEKLAGPARRAALTRLASQLDRDAAGASDGARVHALAVVVRDLAAGQRSGD